MCAFVFGLFILTYEIVDVILNAKCRYMYVYEGT